MNGHDLSEMTKEGCDLRNTIEHMFIHRVQINTVMPLFRSKMKSTEVLTENDVDRIKTLTRSTGNMAGATELLEALMCRYYPRSYPVLMDILRNDSVKQGDLADAIDKEREKLRSTRNLEKTVMKFPQLAVAANIPVLRAPSGRAAPPSRVWGDSKDDFSLDDLTDDAISDDDCSDLLSADMPRQKQASAPSVSFPHSSVPPTQVGESAARGEESLIAPEAARSLFGEPKPSKQSEAEEEATLSQDLQNPSGVSFESGFKVEDNRSEAGTENTYDTIDDPSLLNRPSQAQNRMPVNPARRQYRDFSFVETQSALCEMTGWQDNLNDRTVQKIFKNILARKEDGHFVIWFWQKKKRPAICVSHGGRLVTFVIHRSLSPSAPSQYVYYIDKSQSRANLRDLVQYHLEVGVPNLASGGSEVIKLNNPMPAEETV